MPSRESLEMVGQAAIPDLSSPVRCAICLGVQPGRLNNRTALGYLGLCHCLVSDRVYQLLHLFKCCLVMHFLVLIIQYYVICRQHRVSNPWKLQAVGSDGLLHRFTSAHQQQQKLWNARCFRRLPGLSIVPGIECDVKHRLAAVAVAYISRLNAKHRIRSVSAKCT